MSEPSKTLSNLRTVVEAGSGAILLDGKLLPERQLQEVLGVSRRVIREALQILEDEGLIFRRQGQGTFIRPIASERGTLSALFNRTSPQEIMEVRREVEPALSKLAALRVSPADIETMRKLVTRAAEATTAEDLDRWDRAFHAKIAECVRNVMFGRIYEMIDAARSERNWAAFRERSFNGSNRKQLAAEHFAIVNALAVHDPREAEAMMIAHLETITSMVHE